MTPHALFPLLAQVASDNTLLGLLSAVGVAFGGLLLWIRGSLEKKIDDLVSAVDRNSALLIVLNEAHLVRAMQNAGTEEMKGVVALLREHFEEAKRKPSP